MDLFPPVLLVKTGLGHRVQELPWIPAVLPCHITVTLSSSCLQTHSCVEQPGAGHRASQDMVGRQEQVHWGALMGRDF